MSHLRQHVAAQLSHLRKEAARCPWLLPRLASLLLQAGRVREASALARKHVSTFEQGTDGLLVRAELAEKEGREDEARALWESLCHRLPGIHQGWIQLLAAHREDSVRHLELLRGAWEKDQFSARLNNEMEKSGLRRTADYEQALRPTAAEAARRERQFRRLLDLHAQGVREESGMASGSTREPVPLEEEAAVVSGVDVPADSTQHLCRDAGTGELPSAPLQEEMPTTGVAEAWPSSQVEDPEPESLSSADETDEEGTAPPPSPKRERQLVEQSERLAGLTRPLRLPVDPGARKAARDADLFDPRSMMTRRLAHIYLEQGYPALARRTLEVLIQREPESADLPELLLRVKEAEARSLSDLAESASSPVRRRTPPSR